MTYEQKGHRSFLATQRDVLQLYFPCAVRNFVVARYA